MDKFSNIFLLATKSKHLIPIGALLLINAFVRRNHQKERNSNNEYPGDNVPLSLIEKIKNA